tara:strand:- start:2380 stop:3240 length:861 start_codon:yes stop_codon:yes gene_type:complete
MKILLIGAYGILGTKLNNFLKDKGHDVFRTDRTKFSINSMKFNEYIDQIKTLLKDIEPEIVINLLAATNIENCENNISDAFISNVLSLEKIIGFINQSGAFLIHISTDQVYSSGNKHLEDAVNPCNVYGLTKYTSELIALKTKATVLRINYVGKSSIKSKPSLTDWFINSCITKQKIFLYDDIFFNPLHSFKLCEIIEVVAYKKKLGIYNLGTVNSLSKAQFLLSIYDKLDLNNPNLKVCNYSEKISKVKRPLNMVTNVSRFQDIYDMKLPEIKDTINSVVGDYLT